MVRFAAQLAAHLFFYGVALAADRPGLWLDVPFVKQEKNGCGAASIAMVMQYWQQQQGQTVDANAEQIQRVLYSPQARGIHASDLERYLRQHRFQTFSIHGEWKDLKEHLEKGRPLIVALNGGRGAVHYVVVTGLDRGQEVVLKHDPAERKLLKQHRADFERDWKIAGNWTLVAVPARDRSSSQ